MHRKLLAEKAEQIQKALATWAKKGHVLGPGQRIVFSMRIEVVSTVVRDAGDAEGLLNIEAVQFFTRQRLEAEGGTHSLVSRAMTCVKYRAMDFNKLPEGNRSYRMVDFLRQFPDSREVLRMTNVGKKSGRLIIAAIQRAGLPFIDQE